MRRISAVLKKLDRDKLHQQTRFDWERAAGAIERIDQLIADYSSQYDRLAGARERADD
jgi:hypothetical protein